MINKLGKMLTQESYSQYELLFKNWQKTDEVIDNVNSLEVKQGNDKEELLSKINGKVSAEDFNTIDKLDFKGTWKGLKPTQTNEFIQSQVDKNTEDINSNIHFIKPSGLEDDTDLIQQAFNNYSSTVVKAGNYNVNAVTKIRIPSNRKIEFEEGAIFNVIPNESENYRVLDLFASENVTIINPHLEGDRELHSYIGGGTHEFGHGIMISTGKNINIINPICNNFTGDGISIFRCDNVYIKNPICDNNRRQGISVASAENLTIENPILSNTNGTAPECGLDIETNDSLGKLKNIKIINPLTINNNLAGVMIVPTTLDGSSGEVGITIENHKDVGSVQGFIMSRLESPNKINGFIDLVNPCYIDNRQQSIYITGYTRENSPLFSIKNPKIINCNTQNISAAFPEYGSGIVINRETSEPTTKKIGNIIISNPQITDTRITKLTRRGIYFRDMKNIGFDSLFIENPIITCVDSVDMKIDCGSYSGMIVRDYFETTKQDIPTQYQTLNNKIITKFVNTNAPQIVQINISANHKNSTPIDFINLTSFGMMIVPPAGTTILPISPVGGKYITTIEVGASVRIRKITDTSYIIENIIGTWTAQA